jgi:hypothetical protein
MNLVAGTDLKLRNVAPTNGDDPHIMTGSREGLGLTNDPRVNGAVVTDKDANAHSHPIVEDRRLRGEIIAFPHTQNRVPAWDSTGSARIGPHPSQPSRPIAGGSAAVGALLARS